MSGLFNPDIDGMNQTTVIGSFHPPNIFYYTHITTFPLKSNTEAVFLKMLSLYISCHGATNRDILTFYHFISVFILLALLTMLYIDVIISSNTGYIPMTQQFRNLSNSQG
jgi:hypothetical protein